MLFNRPHHQLVANILHNLDGELLTKHRCYFGGDTAIALLYGEYRESADIDFIVADQAAYRELRLLLASESNISPICKPDVKMPLAKLLRKDQYGIRTAISLTGVTIKFEIVKEGRVNLDINNPAGNLCGVDTLSLVDMVATKLLANSDRWQDDAVYSRDVIDLAMLPWQHVLEAGAEKAYAAYGNDIYADINAACAAILSRPGWLDACMLAMAIDMPKAVMWQHIKKLQQAVSKVGD